MISPRLLAKRKISIFSLLAISGLEGHDQLLRIWKRVIESI